MDNDRKRSGREEGFYWVECHGSVEVLLWKSQAESATSGCWLRAGVASPVPELDVDFVYPARLRAPAWRMDNSVEEELGDFPDPSARSDGREGTYACHDCGLEYPFRGLDLFLPWDEWKQIAPEPNGRGVLCPNCISIRAGTLRSAICLEATIKSWNDRDFTSSSASLSFDSASDEEL